MIVGGVAPGKGGQEIGEIPVFDTVSQAVQETGAEVSQIYVPAPFTADAICEAAEAGTGAPASAPAADAPAPVTFQGTDGWAIGEPDLIVSSKSFDVPATAPDWWGSLGAVPMENKEDRYVAAFEYKERSIATGESTRDTVGGLFVVVTMSACGKGEG